MGLRVAVLGMAPSKLECPDGYEKWGLAWDPDALRYDRVFEMHDLSEIDRPSYLERLGEFPVLYMQDKYLHHAKVYPLSEVSELCGDYFESSVAYMVALAIHEGAEEIGLWGVDMKADEEYAYQRPNIEYLIGLARGKGIKVSIAQSSPVCKFSGCFGYPNRYGSFK